MIAPFTPNANPSRKHLFPLTQVWVDGGRIPRDSDEREERLAAYTADLLEHLSQFDRPSRATREECARAAQLQRELALTKRAARRRQLRLVATGEPIEEAPTTRQHWTTTVVGMALFAAMGFLLVVAAIH